MEVRARLKRKRKAIASVLEDVQEWLEDEDEED